MLTRLFAIAFIILTTVIEAAAQDLSIAQALKILDETKPLLAPLVQLRLTDETKRRANTVLYNEQIAAILVLGKAKNASNTIYLIPFLNYPRKDYSFVRVFITKHNKENIDKKKEDWPAFAAIIETPGSANVLMDYSLDKANPFILRLGALNVLQYLDRNKFQTVSNRFIDEFAGAKYGPQTRAYLTAVEEGKHPFDGLYRGFTNW